MDEVQPELQGKNNITSKYEIMHNSNFGQPLLDHSFKSDACIEHVLVFVFNCAFLSDIDKTNLSDSHPLMTHIDKMLSWSKGVKFVDIREYITDNAK